jgi:hypothetical protein
VLSPLIDALITTHYIVIPGKTDSYTTTFMSTTGPGASVPSRPASSPDSTACSGGDQTKVIPRTVTNEEVLEALIKLSGGANFGLDQKAWRYWLATENRKNAPLIQSRRDQH